MLSWRSWVEVVKLSKITALYTNEMIKLSRKMFVWGLIILMAVSAFALPFMSNRLLSGTEYSSVSEIGKTEITKRRDTVKTALGDPNKYVTHETLRFTLGKETVELFATKLNLDEDNIYDYSNMCCYNAILANYDFEQYPITGTYLSLNAFSEYLHYYNELCGLNVIPFDERDSKWFATYSSCAESFDLAKEAFFYHDYDAYLSLIEKEAGVGNSTQVSIIKRLHDLDPKGTLSVEEAETIHYALSLYHSYQSNLSSGVEVVNGSYVPLSAQRREQIENSLMILDYQISNNCLPTERTERAIDAKQISLRISRFFLVILLILIAGSSISQEMATGSIKSLIIAPVKRWKIFTAKLLALFTWVIAGSILITAISTLSTSIYMGSSALPPYYFCSGGQVLSIPNYLFSLLHFLADNISLFVYMLGAFTISCLSRNTGIAVGISTGLVLTNGVSSLFSEIFGRQRWIDFLPFSNMDLTSNIFPYSNLIGYPSSDGSGLFGSANNSVSLSFSLIYLGVLVFILLLIAYDAFVRKDIQ